MQHIGHKHNQRGAALFAAMIILLAITMLSMASFQTSLLELRMSGNAESTSRALHMSQAAIDNVIHNVQTNFAIVGAPGYMNCTTNVSGCNETSVVLDTPQFDSSSKIIITRRSDAGCVSGSSCTMFKGVTFSIDSEYDKGMEGLGRAFLVQGLIRIIPTFGQTNLTPPTGATSN